MEPVFEHIDLFGAWTVSSDLTLDEALLLSPLFQSIK